MSAKKSPRHIVHKNKQYRRRDDGRYTDDEGHLLPIAVVAAILNADHDSSSHVANRDHTDFNPGGGSFGGGGASDSYNVESSGGGDSSGGGGGGSGGGGD